VGGGWVRRPPVEPLVFVTPGLDPDGLCAGAALFGWTKMLSARKQAMARRAAMDTTESFCMRAPG
jgi:predicted NodU family carbamoyl transferase